MRRCQSSVIERGCECTVVVVVVGGGLCTHVQWSKEEDFFWEV